MARKVLVGIAAILVALLTGFLWGAAGKSTLEDALQQTRVRADLLDARGAVLMARVALYNTNFGESSQNLEQARAAVEHALEGLKALGRDGEVRQLEDALSAIREAQQLAGKLDLASNSRAADAVKALESVLVSFPRQP